jgi:hypothetical protein
MHAGNAPLLHLCVYALQQDVVLCSFCHCISQRAAENEVNEQNGKKKKSNNNKTRKEKKRESQEEQHKEQKINNDHSLIINEITF